MLFSNIQNTIGPTILSGFLFNFASRCIPTFFSVFLLSKGYSNRDIIIISCVFFIGSFLVNHKASSIKKSVKIFHISATIGSIILLLQAYVDKVWGWFFIRFAQGILETICRNALYNVILPKNMQTLVFFMNCGSTVGFLLMCYDGAFLVLFTITGILLNLSHLCLALQSDHTSNKIINNKYDNHTWKDLFKHNRQLFIGIVLSCVLTSSFNTLLPITLRYHGFNSMYTLQIMFVGSLGHTIIQMLSHFLKNIFGVINYMSYVIYILIVMYVLCILSIMYLPILTSVFIFFIIGLHNTINSTITTIIKDTHKVASDLELRNPMNQINNIGSILTAIIALMFINTFPRYGIFALWIVAVIIIKLLMKKVKKNIYH